MTVTVKKNAALIVPPSVRRKAGLKEGDRVEFQVSGRRITIVPKPSSGPKPSILPKSLRGDDEYTPEQRRIIDARLAKADEDIRQGRVYGPFNTAEEMAAFLEAEIERRRAANRKAKRAR
jgi:AbrB family looped-hinge helix DNA binding protein